MKSEPWEHVLIVVLAVIFTTIVLLIGYNWIGTKAKLCIDIGKKVYNRPLTWWECMTF